MEIIFLKCTQTNLYGNIFAFVFFNFFPNHDQSFNIFTKAYLNQFYGDIVAVVLAPSPTIVAKEIVNIFIFI